MLPVVSCWVPCDGLASHPGGVVILLVASCWIPCDGLASYMYLGGSSNAPSCFMLQKLEVIIIVTGTNQSPGLFSPIDWTQTLPCLTGGGQIQDFMREALSIGVDIRGMLNQIILLLKHGL